MKIDRNRLKDPEAKLLGHILLQYPDHDERRSLLTAIHTAFLFGRDAADDPFDLPISPELVSALATFSITLLKQEGNDYPFLPVIILRAFLASLVACCHAGKLKMDKAELILGSFKVPSWLLVHSQTFDT